MSAYAPSEDAASHSSEAEVRRSATVAIPTYKRPEMLERLLEKLGPQVARESAAVDVLVIDNDPEQSARRIVEALETQMPLRYVHETRRGVAHARSRAVSEAVGDYLIFLDDDEEPSAHWLSAWLSQADGQIAASFGKVVARLEAPAPDGLEHSLVKMFSRDLGEHGQDVTTSWFMTGTGNSMFLTSVCFRNEAPFDERFARRGGEDVWFISGLVDRGVRLNFNREASVEEIVPSARTAFRYVCRRRFNQGQLRVIMECRRGGASGALRAVVWTGLGAAQFGVSAVRALALRALGRATWRNQAAAAFAGLGKLFWWAESPERSYG